MRGRPPSLRKRLKNITTVPKQWLTRPSHHSLQPGGVRTALRCFEGKTVSIAVAFLCASSKGSGSRTAVLCVRVRAPREQQRLHDSRLEPRRQREPEQPPTLRLSKSNRITTATFPTINKTATLRFEGSGLNNTTPFRLDGNGYISEPPASASNATDT